MNQKTTMTVKPFDRYLDSEIIDELRKTIYVKEKYYSFRKFVIDYIENHSSFTISDILSSSLLEQYLVRRICTHENAEIFIDEYVKAGVLRADSGKYFHLKKASNNHEICDVI